MMADFLALALVRAHLAVSAAILVVLLIRPLVRRLLGAELAYGLWAVVPVVAVTSLFPNLSDFLGLGVHGTPLTLAARIGSSSLVLALFAGGALALAAVFILAEWRFRRAARRGLVGPAIMGLSWPRMITPSDYETRFNPAERRLIRQHEQTHVERGDPKGNLVIAACQMLGWFNPLVHLAAHCARLDQEIACDAVVIGRNPGQRRLYGETLLKAQTGGGWSAFACALAEGGRHPLEVRIGQLGRGPISLRRYMVGATMLGFLGWALAMGVWSLTPETMRPDTERAPYDESFLHW